MLSYFPCVLANNPSVTIPPSGLMSFYKTGRLFESKGFGEKELGWNPDSNALDT